MHIKGSFRGTLTLWHERGFGFVMLDGSRKEFFLHATQIVEGPPIPKQGSIVEFEIGTPRRPDQRPMAINARILPAEAR